MPEAPSPILRPPNRLIKRTLDLVGALFGLLLMGWWLLPVLILLARRSTGDTGLFRQARVGRHGKLFNVLKLRTMRLVPEVNTTVTTSGDVRITPFGCFLRRTKLDELPQLINILRGEMSFVGPRPDVPGYADRLQGEDRMLLEIRPGITGPATLRFRHEEELLAAQPHPEAYNREVIWPEKVRLNREYMKSYRWWHDLYWIWKTVF